MAAQIMASEGDYVTVKLPSGELRLIHGDCYATIGQVGNPDHINICWARRDGTAGWAGGESRRGMARNPVDHPMGGGQGKSKGGGGWHHPVRRGANWPRAARRAARRSTRTRSFWREGRNKWDAR